MMAGKTMVAAGAAANVAASADLVSSTAELKAYRKVGDPKYLLLKE